MKEPEMELIAGFIHEALTQRDNANALHSIRERVVALNRNFPLP
jgi:glycine/serine hydroxymethyltransferase